MEVGSRFVWISRILTFLWAYLLVINYSGYTQPDTVVLQREGIITQLETEAAKQKNDTETRDATDYIKAEAQMVLVPDLYQKHSMYRMVGCLITLIGVVLLRNLKSLGFHLLSAGTIFLIFTGFYSFGFGIFGWLFNLLYLAIGLFSVLYYMGKRELLS
jgi:hypothetical protein